MSPYFMAFGFEAVLPAEVAFQSLLVEYHDEVASDEAREVEVNAAEQCRLDTYA